MQPAGIYVVRNTVEGKLLLGASRNLPAGLNSQRAQLRFGGHRNRALQADWNRLGEDAFIIEVHEELKPAEGTREVRQEDLEALLALVIAELQPWGKDGYHTPPHGDP
ncbi:MAG: ArsR family transcriptional regulator [Gemmatimonas sp.]|nr:ArsR family transcriptional regulator [Gemmatimonas sp.]